MIYPWLNLIVAMTQHEQGIGLYNSLPWPRITEDMLRFKRLTLGCSVIMGNKTFKSLGTVLGERKNIVLTTDTKQLTIPHTHEACFVSSVNEALDEAVARMTFPKGNGSWVIGGSQVYREFLPYVSRMYITLVKQKFYCDRFFPLVDKAVWQLESSEPGENKEIPVEFQVWSRKYEQ